MVGLALVGEFKGVQLICAVVGSVSAGDLLCLLILLSTRGGWMGVSTVCAEVCVYVCMLYEDCVCVCMI